MYNSKNRNMLKKLNIYVFLVMNPRMSAEVGGDLLLTKITRPHKAVSVGFGSTMFQEIDKGSLIICDNILLETLRYTRTRAAEAAELSTTDPRPPCSPVWS